MQVEEYRPTNGGGLSFILDTFINISVAVFIFSIIYFFVAQPHQVDGASMLDTYHHGDYVLTEKITQRFRGFNRGDVIVFHYPKDPTKDYIKRIVALPTETIEIRDGLVIIDDVPLEEPYTSKQQTLGHAFLREAEPYTLGEGEYIVLGDNRKESSDSREWGPVPESFIVGKVFFRYWPLSRAGFMNGR